MSNVHAAWQIRAVKRLIFLIVLMHAIHALTR